MFDPKRTRQNYQEWLKSPDFKKFAERFGRVRRQWPRKFGPAFLVIGLILTVGVAVLARTGVIPRSVFEGWFVYLPTAGLFLFVSGFVISWAALRDAAAVRRDVNALRKDFQKLDITLCGIVIANRVLLEKTGEPAPALLVGALAPYTERLGAEICRAATLSGELYGREPGSVPPEFREACALVNDDEHQYFRRRPVPRHLCREYDLILFDAVLFPDNWAAGMISRPFVVCAASPEPEGIILHLPDRIVAWTQSESGAPILRHDKVEESKLTFEESPYAREIEKHIERHLGDVPTVFHEIVSTTVHVDIHIVPPAPSREWTALVTCGMSTHPMNTPKGAEHFRRAELMLRLPPDWPVSHDDLKNEANYWPMRWLKQLVRFPHLCKTWLSAGHSIPNGDPAEPLHPSVKFTGWVLARPFAGGEGFETLECEDGEHVYFFSLIPVFPSEMEFKLSRGMEALLAEFAKAGVTDLLNVDRAPVV